MADNFGSGPSLDQQLDFSVDVTGDILSENGIEELKKDLAFQMIINLSQYLGAGPSGNIETQVAGTAKRVALADERVSSVSDDKTIVEFSDDREELTVHLTVRTVGGESELVFNV